MGWAKALVAVALLGSLGYAAQQPSGLCQYDTPTGGMMSADCRFPSCPFDMDCQPPKIDTSSAKIQYDEPLIQWKGTCPDATISGPCWEVHINITFNETATDASGVQAIGVHLASEVNAQRTFTKYWQNVQRQSGPNYSMQSEILAHVPPGERLELAVYELCAKDLQNNEGCVLPANSRGLSFSISH
jgi:hypothetical protein